MEDKKNMLQEWLLRATKDIRFGPDRKAVSAELQEHIEDKIFDLKRLYPGMSDEAAAQRALDQMGDAAEIGRELAKIHRPWLGYLWRCSQVLLGVFATFLAFLALTGLFSKWPGHTSESVYAGEGINNFIQRYLGLEAAREPIDLELPVPIQMGEYTITFQKAEFWRSNQDISGRQFDQIIHFVFEVEYDRPWESPYQFIERMWAEDEKGQKVYAFEEIHDALGALGYPPTTLWPQRLKNELFRSVYEITVPVPSEDARSIDLRYTYLGADLTIPFIWEEVQP